jgi:uncharacterized membrane protein YgdD (TMEM256/DUF423 family)
MGPTNLIPGAETLDSPQPDRLFATLGAVFMAVGVGLGAFGAHALKARLSVGDLAIFETGVRYQLLHALGLFAVAWASTRYSTVWVASAGWLLTVGIIVFSGSLYALVLTNTRWLGAVTPIGGLAFILGWLALAGGIYRS